MKKDLNDYGCSFEIAQDEKQSSQSKSNQIKWAKQRKKRGFDDTETWNLDNTFAQFAIPRLKRFKEVVNCHPGGLTFEEWKDIIQKMIDSFEEIEKDNKFSPDYDHVKVQAGLDLFHKYFLDLWW